MCGNGTGNVSVWDTWVSGIEYKTIPQNQIT